MNDDVGRIERRNDRSGQSSPTCGYRFRVGQIVPVIIASELDA